MLQGNSQYYDCCNCHCCSFNTYHQDMDEVSGRGVPHLQRQIVGGCDHRAVMAIPRYHGNLQLSYLIFQRRRVVLPAGIILRCLDQLILAVLCRHNIKWNKRNKACIALFKQLWKGRSPSIPANESITFTALFYSLNEERANLTARYYLSLPLCIFQRLCAEWQCWIQVQGKDTNMY